MPPRDMGPDTAHIGLLEYDSGAGGVIDIRVGDDQVAHDRHGTTANGCQMRHQRLTGGGRPAIDDDELKVVGLAVADRDGIAGPRFLPHWQEFDFQAGHGLTSCTGGDCAARLSASTPL